MQRRERREETDEGDKRRERVRTLIVGLEGDQGVGVDDSVAKGRFVRQRVLRGSGGSGGGGSS